MTEKKDCQLCGHKQMLIYVDGATRRGPWGNMCTKCHATHGVGLGTGKGQKYLWDPQKQDYRKVEG